MRFGLLLIVLFLCGGEGSFVRPEDLGRKVHIQRRYAAREACLARNANADGTATTDPAMLAHAVATACSPETEALVTASNFDGDATVATNIRQDSGFRAMKYVMQARGQAIF